MQSEPLELFYSYAHADEALRDQLNTHLALLQQQGLIRPWHDREISAGSLWDKEINIHLKSARIILLLVSPNFIASDYCYGVEMQEALKRHIAGEARVIPIILRQCDWESAPFGNIQALPKNAKPVKIWPDRDVAFTDITKGIRKIVEELTGQSTADVSQNPNARKKSGKQVEGKEGRRMAVTPTTISAPIIKRAVEHYHKELAYYRKQASDELGLRAAFQNLLVDVARHVNWKISPERTIEGNIRPDGILRDEFDLRRGFWEAKGPKGNLEKEIEKKIADGYPLTNTVFENTERAVLYQNKKRVDEYNLTNPKGVGDLLQQFLTYTEPDIENFEIAVEEFKERIPELAKALLSIIEKEQKQNKKFITAFDTFTSLCQNALNPKISTDAIKEMLVQHLLTERLFRTVFNNPDFVHRNVIAAEIETVIQALTIRAFNRQDFLKSLDRFYVAIEKAAKGIENWSERQHFLNTVYERFFQGFSVKQADTLGIVYTPQEIVDFMCASMEEVLQSEFGMFLSDAGVKILDPATGTGNFIVNLISRLPKRFLKEKYTKDLFCNEITLLPYYIASLNIEHEYFARIGEYKPFEGICFADTLELAERKQLTFDFFTEENTERVEREKNAQIMIVVGNPPYNVGQKNENENNKNRRYKEIDDKIHETYAKASAATLNNKLYDAYVKFFRWATDRLQEGDGIICFVSNNSFINNLAFDGMRKHLAQDFTHIYHIDLGGDARKGLSGNVFGIMVGVGITILIRHRSGMEKPYPPAAIYYYKINDNLSKSAKLSFLAIKKDVKNIEWQNLKPDRRHTWITEGMQVGFDSFLSIGSKNAKIMRISDSSTLFKMYALGVSTNRDRVVYDFDSQALASRVEQFIEDYNAEIARWVRAGKPEDIDNFVNYHKIKWSRNLKRNFKNEHYAQFDKNSIRKSLYRPFTSKVIYHADILVDELSKSRLFFPNQISESENAMIIVSDHGFRASFSTLATNLISDLHVLASTDGFQCFPYYTYSEDGGNRRENITNWALQQFRQKYSSEITKWDIFHYVYGMLHHPQYRQFYVENLKRDLPHIPLLKRHNTFLDCVNIGKHLMAIHLNYEQAKEYPLQWFESNDVPFSWSVEKMRLSTDKRVVVVNESLRLGPLPLECFEYRLGNRSALEWVIDQYQVREDKQSGIVSNPNRLDDEEYIVRLVGKVVTVSVETVRLVKELAQVVTMEDWMEESVNGEI